MSHRNYLVDAVNTQEVVPRERVDYWANLVDSFHGRMSYSYRQRNDFQGVALRQRSVKYQIIEWTSAEACYRRTKGCIRAEPDDSYRLLFPTSGKLLLRSRDDGLCLTPGVAAVAAMSQEFELWQRRNAGAVVMTIPRREMELRLPAAEPLGVRLDLTVGLGRVIADMARGMVREREHLSSRQFDATSDRLVELLCMLIHGDDRPTSSPHLADVESAIRHYVRAHSDDPRLDGPAIANALGWSLRQIQLALQEAGTSPRRLIKEERLRLAMYRLRNPQYNNYTIGRIASQLGFSSLSAFSTAFREYSGSSPSSFREE